MKFRFKLYDKNNSFPACIKYYFLKKKSQGTFGSRKIGKYFNYPDGQEKKVVIMTSIHFSNKIF